MKWWQRVSSWVWVLWVLVLPVVLWLVLDLIFNPDEILTAYGIWRPFWVAGLGLVVYVVTKHERYHEGFTAGVASQDAIWTSAIKSTHVRVDPRISVGSRVVLTRVSQLLAEQHGATLGSVGTVTAWSRLDDRDLGYLVDWGDGAAVRCDINELAEVTE